MPTPTNTKTVANLLATIDPDLDTAADEGLRQSFQSNGWLAHRPAVKDEHGVVICGNRRLRIATALGISLHVKVHTFGDGDTADLDRLKMALADNSGNSDRTNAQRKRYAEHLYRQGLTQQKIAAALGVSHQTIGRDLGNLSMMDNSPRPKTASNPKGAGRPKGSGRVGKRGTVTPTLDIAREIVREKIDANQTISPHSLQKEHGISHVTFDTAIQAEAARKAALGEAYALDLSHLSKSGRERVEQAIRAYRAKLDREYQGRLERECEQWHKDVHIPDYHEYLAQAKQVMNARRGIFTVSTYKLIERCLHPDNSASPETRSQAFDAFRNAKVNLCDNKEMPINAPALPSTVAEWLAKGAAVRAKRAADRAAKIVAKNNVTKR